MPIQRIPCEPLEHPLAHLVGGLDVERDAREDTEGAKPDHQPIEVGVSARGGDQLAIGGNDLQAGDGHGKVAAGVARTVGSGCDGPRDRDVGQGRHVVQGEALVPQRAREIAVRQTCPKGHRPRRALYDQVRGQPRERHQLRRVSDVAEGVPRPQRSYPGCGGDDLSQLLQRRRPMHPLGTVRVVGSPVDLGHATDTLTHRSRRFPLGARSQTGFASRDQLAAARVSAARCGTRGRPAKRHRCARSRPGRRPTDCSPTGRWGGCRARARHSVGLN